MTSAQPLHQLRVLVTRARKQAGNISTRLRELGADVVEVPTIEIRPPASYAALDAALRSLDPYKWLILTSVNGVDALFARMAELAIPATSLNKLQIAAIGPSTQKAIEAHGFKVAVVPKNYIAEDVVEALRERVTGQHVLLVRAKVARDVIPSELRNAGAMVDVAEAYETVLPEAAEHTLRELFSDPRRSPQLVCLTSSSTAANFLAAAPEAAPQILNGTLLCASIGPVTSNTLRERGLPVAIEASQYTIDGLITAIIAHFEKV